jgi:lipopolysaccharide/colanic/teichoic acid biosynthesis glycosyltransferase
MDEKNPEVNYLEEIAKIKLPFKPVDLPCPKRAFDIIFCLVLLILLLPLILIILIVHYLEQVFSISSRGPLIYSEVRISKGKPFNIYKFRIFKALASRDYLLKHGFVQTKALEQDKNNLTLAGRFLKQIYMDELPQIFNVLKGEMTLVGPRPSNEVVTLEDGLA